MACVSHASDRMIFEKRMRNVGKRPRDESGKYPVNEDDEEKFQARISLAHVCVHSGAAPPKISREAAIAVPSSSH